MPKFPPIPIPIPGYSPIPILPTPQIADTFADTDTDTFVYDFLKFITNIILHVLQFKKTLKGNYLLLSTSSYTINNQFAGALNQTKVSYK